MNVDKVLQQLKEKCDLSFLYKKIELVRFTDNKNTATEIFVNIVKCMTAPEHMILQFTQKLSDNLCNIIYGKINYEDSKVTEYFNGFIAFQYKEKYYRIYVDIKYDTDSYSEMMYDCDVIRKYSLQEYDSLLDLFESNDGDLSVFLDFVTLYECSLSENLEED